MSRNCAAQVRNTREKNLAGHRHGKLAALHRLRPLVGRLELGVHPLVSEEARAVLGDSVSADQAHRLPHDVGAVAVSHSLQAGQRTLAWESRMRYCTSGSASSAAYRAASRSPPAAPESDEIHGVLLQPAKGLHLRGPRGDSLLGELPVLELLQRVQLVEQPGGGKTERRRRLARGPDVDQAQERVLLLLQAHS